MKVIVNSDNLYSGLLTDKLPPRVQALLRVCKDIGATVVIPRTTLLEFERRQSELVQENINALETAYSRLEKFGVRFERIEPASIIGQPDLYALMKAFGVRVQIEEPTLEDFQEAHRRACLHLPPQPKNSKSDEMRDLVIWIMALRLSRDGGALLVSRDHVHTSKEGLEEASKATLLRAKDIEEALDLLGVETPAGKCVKELLTPIWGDLLAAGAPLPPEVSLAGVADPSFIQGEGGPAEARFTVKVKTPDGRSFRAAVKINQSGGVITKASFSGITIDDDQWKVGSLVIEPRRSLQVDETGFQERLAALREVLGGSQL